LILRRKSKRFISTREKIGIKRERRRRKAGKERETEKAPFERREFFFKTQVRTHIHK